MTDEMTDEMTTEMNEQNYAGKRARARFKLQFSYLTAPQRERIQALITGAETLHAAGQSAAATDILMIASDFCDGYTLQKPPAVLEKPTAEQYDAATEARQKAEEAAGRIKHPDERRVMEFLITDAGELLPESPISAAVCYEAAERHARYVLRCEAKEENKEA